MRTLHETRCRFSSISKPIGCRISCCALRKSSSEKEVVANERKLRVDDDVEGKALELLYDSAFRRHPYGWPTIGWMRDIRGFTVRDCQQFYRTHYAPSNATVVIAGDFNERKALSLVQKRYGGMSAARTADTSDAFEGAFAQRKPSGSSSSPHRLQRKSS